MKIFLPGLLLFISSFAFGLASDKGTLLLTHDSLLGYPNSITNLWKFIAADLPAMANADYDDKDWKEVNPLLRLSEDSVPKFNGIGWFRLHFKADTSVMGKPLAMTMTHFG